MASKKKTVKERSHGVFEMFLSVLGGVTLVLVVAATIVLVIIPLCGRGFGSVYEISSDFWVPTPATIDTSKDLICGPFSDQFPAFMYCRPGDQVRDLFGLSKPPGTQSAQ